MRLAALACSLCCPRTDPPGRPRRSRGRWQRARRAREGGNESARGDDGLGAASAQTGEERRTRCQPDGVGEQHEPELAQQPKTAGVAEGFVDRADGQAREEGGSRTERHTLDANRADSRTERDNQEDEQDRVVSENVDHRAGPYGASGTRIGDLRQEHSRPGALGASRRTSTPKSYTSNEPRSLAATSRSGLRRG